ncbi:hypothetical protein MSG28_012111 [Choristoneura fumiferana]|uniref:Uncharacterized protein n=1 Tax=Choristoneura fumiferana TaxID=7141 RepID=A0ACC0KCG1_CHOFU|nr:hypothetical protein MSG28_012111 [Choristoneura fumiferana]
MRSGRTDTWSTPSRVIVSESVRARSAEAEPDGGVVRYSDGLVRVWRLEGDSLVELHALEAHQYPAQCVAWGGAGGGGALLVSAGLDGRAVLWDAEVGAGRVCLRSAVRRGPSGVSQAGCRLRALAAGAAGARRAAGRRGAALSPHRPPLLLLATDDGLAPVWSLAEDDPSPIQYVSLPTRHFLCYADGIRREAEGSSASIQLARRVAAHGGGAAVAAWGAGRAGRLLCSAGAEHWARVWAAGGGAQLAAAPAPRHSGGALAAALLAPADGGAVHLALGTLQGHVALWRLRAPPEGARGRGGRRRGGGGRAGPALVDRRRRAALAQGIRRAWAAEAETALLAAARGAGLAGAALLDAPLPRLMTDCGFESTESDDEESPEAALASSDEDEPPRARLRRELRWLRRAPHTAIQVARRDTVT